MIAVACVSASVGPEAFGLDEIDRHAVAAEMLQVLKEESDKAAMERARTKFA